MTSNNNTVALDINNDMLSNQACSGNHRTLPLEDQGGNIKSSIHMRSQLHRDHRDIVEIPHSETEANQVSTQLPQAKIFSNVHIYFVQNSMNKLQLKLWREKIATMGGEIQNNFDQKTTTHVVTEIKNIERVKHLLNIKVLPQHTEILSSRWISDSITNGALQAPNSYRVEGESSSTLIAQHLNSTVSSSFKSKRKRYEHSDTEDEDNAEILNIPTSNKEMIPQDFDITDSNHIQNRQLVLDASKRDANQTTDILMNLISEVKSGEISELSDDESEILAKDRESKEHMNSNKNDNNFDVNTWKMAKDRFVCMTSHVIGNKLQDPNHFIIEKFEVLQRYYELTQDQYRAISYRKAITAIKKYNKKLTSKEEALKLFGVGQKTANKVVEIIETGQLRRLKNLENTIDSLELLCGIYGVGSQQAIKWINQGHRTLEDIRRHCQLNPTQTIGLKYYEELKERMPRKEVTEISAIIQQTAHIIDHKLECITMGSYRRGLATCGDVDIIITRDPSDGITHSGVLPKLLNILHNAGYLTDDLALPQAGDSLSIKYMGIFQLPGGKHRHLDILMVPYNEMGAALLYFTGNDIFNRSIRLLARKKKMRLNQRGLFKDVFRGPAGVKITEGTIIAQRTEKEIFDALNVPWLEPHERNP